MCRHRQEPSLSLSLLLVSLQCHLTLTPHLTQALSIHCSVTVTNSRFHTHSCSLQLTLACVTVTNSRFHTHSCSFQLTVACVTVTNSRFHTHSCSFQLTLACVTVTNSRFHTHSCSFQLTLACVTVTNSRFHTHSCSCQCQSRAMGYVPSQTGAFPPCRFFLYHGYAI